MSFILTRFDTTDLPLLDAKQSLSTGRAASPRLRLATGGAYRLNGRERAQRGEVTVSASGIVRGDTLAAFDAAHIALRRLWGRVGKLYRKTAAGYTQWAWAECVEVPLERATGSHLWVPVSMTFVVDSGFWHGVRHGPAATWGDPDVTWGGGYTWGDIGDTFTLDTSPKVLTVTNEGDYPVNDGTVRIVVGDTTLTSITVANAENGTGFTWTGSGSTTDVLVIDCASQDVTLDGVAAYSGFTPLLGQWLVFEEGDNEITVTRTGGGTDATIRFDYYSGHT